MEVGEVTRLTQMHCMPTAAASQALVDTRLSSSLSTPKAAAAGLVAGQTGLLSAGRGVGDSGSSVATSVVQARRGGALLPQNIRTEKDSEILADQVDRANDEAIMKAGETMSGVQCTDLLGSSMHVKNAAKGMSVFL
jgi:hypothetical protein